MKSADISIIGPDSKGIVATITNFIFENQCNIEEVSQNVVNGTFFMNVKISINKKKFDKEIFNKELAREAKQLGMKSRVFYDEQKQKKNMAILVTKEDHVLSELLMANKDGKLDVNIPIVIGTMEILEDICKKYKIRFICIKDRQQSSREDKILKILDENNVDFVVLARYMKILSPRFVWNYPNRIINVHPSLLPAFPGAMAYMQAFEKGVKISGATSHFVTVDLDQGPIITQEAFTLDTTKSLEEIKKSGRDCENKALIRAVTLFTNNKLECRWGKVIINKKN
ncbi:MAG: formyltetrahydrofolate deformylase [Thaumarchaeota archaeon]|nr:formyltetrahydrofolate deformylase [Nitrososphaerota archaeon]NSL77242.1 formyltetrahydrofolate deformylase [Nitrososphaerota archaeon]